MLVMLLAAALASPSLDEPPARIAAADLQADLAILRRAFEELHPGLHRYATPAQRALDFAAVASAFQRDLTRREAFLELSRFTAKIRCGHTFLNPANQSTTVVNELFSGQDKVPFCFRWLDRRMIVTRDLSPGARLEPGSEVVAIDGIPATTLLAALLTVTRADGANDAKRISLLEVQGNERYETFDLFFPLLFPRTAPTFELDVRRFGEGTIVKVTLEALTWEQRLAARKDSAPAPTGADGPLWTRRELDARTALLSMPSWVVYDTSWNWRGYLDSTFTELAERSTENLVIDLRGNEGGSSVGDVLLSYLIEAPVTLAEETRWVRYRKTPRELDAALDTWDDSFRDWGSAAIGPIDGFYRLTRFDDGGDAGTVIEPAEPRFAGRVVVLIDASNSSATFEFARAVRQLRVATLVGQATGGNQRGIHGGAFFFLRLPRSGLEIDLPLIGHFPRLGSMERPDAGIVPDVVVMPSAASIAAGSDAELDRVARLLANGS